MSSSITNIDSNTGLATNGFTISFCEKPIRKPPLNIIQGDLKECLEKIKNGKWENKIGICKRLYSDYLVQGNKESYDKEKKKLAVIAVSGIFKNQFLNSEEHLKEYTKWIILDIDSKDNHFIKTPTDVEILKEKLEKVNFIYAMFISPSGYGLKILVKGNQIQNHHGIFFNFLAKFFRDNHSVTIDPKCTNLNRLCYVSYDPNIYINPTASILEINIPSQTQFGNISEAFKSKGINNMGSTNKKQYRAHNNEETLNSILNYLKDSGQSITDDYNNWLKLGLALINEFKKEPQIAKKYFCEFSKLDVGKYRETECNNQFQQLCKDNKQQVNFATILYLAKQKGFQLDNSMISGYLPVATNILQLRSYGNFFKRLDEIILFEYFIVKARAFKGVEFYHSSRTIEEETKIKRTRQEKIISYLRKNGILEIQIKGCPNVRHFKVNFDAIIDLSPEIYLKF